MRDDTRSEYQNRIEAAVQFVLGRLDNPPSPIEVADHVGFSRFHFGRIFSLAIGESIAEFTRRIRLERAAWQLETSDYSVTEIAFEAGYESLEGFSRAFRDMFREAPSEFRQHPSRPEIQSASEVHWCPEGRRSTPCMVLDEDMKMEAKIEHVKEMTVVALRHVGPYYQIGPKFGELAGWFAKNQLPVETVLGVFRDIPDMVPAAELRSDACIVVANDFELPNTEGLDLRLDKVSAGEYATATHMGSYEGLGDAWARFCGQAVPKLGREISMDSPSFEIYRNDCRVVPPEDVRTDLYMKVK